MFSHPFFYFILFINVRKENLILESQRRKLLEFAGVNIVANSNFISVDIQEAYKDAFTFDIYSFTSFLNENYSLMRSLTFLYNGESMGFPGETDYKYWLLENGLDEEVLDGADFYDKGYAFFRYCMDTGIDESEIVDLIKFMINHNINDSRDIDEEMWGEFMSEYNYDESDIRELLEYADDMINIPDLMEYLERFGGDIVITGGGINECLKEVEIALDALDKSYKVYDKFVY